MHPARNAVPPCTDELAIANRAAGLMATTGHVEP